MENAAKALLMAGGILLAILTMSLIVYLTSSASRIANSQDKRKEAQQLAEFNKSYEAYNKTRMYGTDIITVVNKAINHNKSIEAQTTEPYYVNIKIHVNQDFITTGKVINNLLPSSEKDYEKDMTKEEIMAKGGSGTDITTYGLAKNNDGDYYELGTWDSNGSLEMNKGIESFFSQDVKDKTVKEINESTNKIYYIYSGLTNFKTAIFKCVDVDYSDVTGRVKEMTFEQIDINT